MTMHTIVKPRANWILLGRYNDDTGAVDWLHEAQKVMWPHPGDVVLLNGKVRQRGNGGFDLLFTTDWTREYLAHGDPDELMRQEFAGAGREIAPDRQ